MNNRLAQLHDFALAVAPELKDSGLNIVAHQPDWPVGPHTVAYAVLGRHIGVRDLLLSEGRWPGYWGSTIAFVTLPETESEQLALLLHELGHVLPARQRIPDDDIVVTPELRNFQRVQLESIAQGRVIQTPWEGHEEGWIRRVLHLVHRAEQLGVTVPLELARVAGQPYGLTPAHGYLVELGCEPAYMARKSFAEIEAEPMPPRFTRLFERDCAEWRGLYQEQL